MRVAIDATPLSVKSGGIRRYTEELARALARTFVDDEYALVSDQPLETNLAVRRGGASGFAGRRWWTYGVQREMRRLGSEVFHGTDFAVPYLPLRPSVMTLHDLSPWRTETAGPTSARVRRRTPILLRLRLPTMVITPTAAIRNEAIFKFSLPPETVVAVPEAASLCFRRSEHRSQREKPYFLFAGTIEPRKNVEALVAAWRELRNEANLVIIGRQSSYSPIIIPEPGLERLENVPDPALREWYSGAAAFVYPSFYEGFGLPVLEAMQCGAVVITSRDRAISEVAGGGAIQVDANNVSALRDAMRAVLRPGFAEEWRQRGLKRAAEFSWERTAGETRRVYAEAIRRFRR